MVAGESYEKPFGPNLRFILKPNEYGWRVVIKDERDDEDLSRLTPPFHFVPNPRDLEGWHFRNALNTGPNDPNSGPTVNAPGEIRDFIFSPDVGRTIDGPDTTSTPSEGDIELVESFGRGELRILEYELSDTEPGKRARFAWIRFSAELSWPAQNSGPCLQLQPKVESIIGTLVRRTFPGPPNYRSVKNGDRAETFSFVDLAEPVCVAGVPSNHLDAQEAADVIRIQLVLLPAQYASQNGLVGRKVQATGTLFTRQNGHHHTAVLLNVAKLEGVE